MFLETRLDSMTTETAKHDAQTAIYALTSYISEHYNTPTSEIYVNLIAFNNMSTGWQASMETLYPVDAYFTVVFNMDDMTLCIDEYQRVNHVTTSCEINN